MYRRIMFAFLVLLLAVPAILWANPVPVLEPSWFATPPLTAPHTPIALVLSNTSQDTIQIGSTAPWQIVQDTTIVYQPAYAFCWAMEIPPGGSLTWHWGQQDLSGNQVDPGTYYGKIRWWYSNEGAGSSHTSYAQIDIFGGVYWAATPDTVPQGSGLLMTLTNAGTSDIVIADSHPWFITDMDSVTVYDPGGTTALETIVVGQSKAWPWDLNNNDGSPVDPGNYAAVVDYYNASGSRRSRAQDQFTIIPNDAGEVVWVVEPPVNSTKSMVALTLTNATTDTIWLSNTVPWHIEDENDNVIYTPFACFVFVPVPPGATWAWAWDERDNFGDYVSEGKYTAVIGFSRSHSSRGSTRDTREFDFYLYELDPQPPCLFVESDDYIYEEGETIGFTFTNCAPDTVGMLSQHTWWITNQIGFPVYWPIVLCAHAEFAPMEYLDFTWDQTDILGNQVPWGVYYAVVEFTDKHYLTRYVAISNPVGIAAENGVPETHAAVGRLEQSFPNPARRATTISYGLTKRGQVSLEVYSVAGQLVRTLVDEVQESEPQDYVVNWDGTDESGRALPSGVYFYKLTTDASIQTRKLVLMR